MSATALGAIVAIVVGYAGGLAATLQYLGHRMDRVEDRLRAIEIAQSAYAQKVDDHITNHPGPSTHLVTR
jgi:hypothetical protein